MTSFTCLESSSRCCCPIQVQHWSKRDDIKAELKADLIILLAENDYPPVDRDEVYKEIFEQAENFKRNR